MKRIVCLVIGFCLLMMQLSVFAKEEKAMNVYTVKYNSGTETEIADTTEAGHSEVLETKITKIRPERDGFEFLGWAYAEKDYDNNPLLQPGEAIKISSSVELFAIWKNRDELKISYLDGPVEALPAQLAERGTINISEMIPRKNGYSFAGWSYSGADGTKILMPGDSIDVEGNVVLIARWEQGTISKPQIELRESVPGAAYFGCENAEEFDGVVLKVEALTTSEESSYVLKEGRVKVDDLGDGAYQAWIVAEKSGIEYKSVRVNFVISEGVDMPENPLAVYMDGQKLYFDLPPVLLDGHTFVTLRYFCEYLGANVLWEEESRTAIITYNGTRMKIQENSDICFVDGLKYQLPTKTVILSSKMFIPLRSVAELCKCEIIWDPARKVYMFSDMSNVFDKNIFTVSGNNGRFMSVDEDGLFGASDAEISSMWVFDAVDADKGIYEIYNFWDMAAPLEVKISEMKEEQPLRLWEKSGYDGYLWKVTECGEGEYFIQPANNSDFYMDAANMCITEEETKVFLEKVYR